MSETKRRSRGGRQFGFGGPRKQTRTPDNDVSVDDILDSLSRRAQITEKLDPVERAPMEEELEQAFVPEPGSGHVRLEAGHHAIGKYAFALMLVGGVVIVGLFGALKSLTDFSSILRVIQSPGFAAVFTDPVKLGLVALFCVIPAMIIRHRRRVRSPLLYA